MPGRLHRAAVGAFVVLHLSALAWWVIPADGFPKDARSATLPAALASFEGRLFAFKKAYGGSLPSRALERWVYLTATWQNWRLFAPNPPDRNDWITVLGVIDATPEGGPVYDPVPLYRSYEGTLPLRLRARAGAYRHDPKLVENLSGGPKAAVASFAEYWDRVYRQERGRPPLAVHVLVRRAMIPTPFSGAAAPPPQAGLLWQYRDPG